MTAVEWALTVVGAALALAGLGFAGFGVWRLRHPLVETAIGPFRDDMASTRPAVRAGRR